MPQDTTRDASAELIHRRGTQWMTRVHGRLAIAAGRRSAAELEVVNLSNDPQILVDASRPLAYFSIALCLREMMAPELMFLVIRWLGSPLLQQRFVSCKWFRANQFLS